MCTCSAACQRVWPAKHLARIRTCKTNDTGQHHGSYTRVHTVPSSPTFTPCVNTPLSYPASSRSHSAQVSRLHSTAPRWSATSQHSGALGELTRACIEPRRANQEQPRSCVLSCCMICLLATRANMLGSVFCFSGHCCRHAHDAVATACLLDRPPCWMRWKRNYTAHTAVAWPHPFVPARLPLPAGCCGCYCLQVQRWRWRGVLWRQGPAPVGGVRRLQHILRSRPSGRSSSSRSGSSGGGTARSSAEGHAVGHRNRGKQPRVSV